MVTINPLDVFYWTVRRNERDVVNLYEKLSPIMKLATGGNMLNFGLWDNGIHDPIIAQNNMCDYVAKLSELNSADTIADIGSGLSEPAKFWKNEFQNLKVFCINTNFEQLRFNQNSDIDKINSTATKLPFADNSVDRVIALESAQHFKPLRHFFNEAKRILNESGIITVAIPITTENKNSLNLGILNFTWSSEHYSKDFVMDLASESGFNILSESLVGAKVYDALADYYIENRAKLQQSILKKYPQLVETILYKSILQMKKLSQGKVIDYLILKCNT